MPFPKPHIMKTSLLDSQKRMDLSTVETGPRKRAKFETKGQGTLALNEYGIEALRNKQFDHALAYFSRALHLLCAHASRDSIRTSLRETSSQQNMLGKRSCKESVAAKPAANKIFSPIVPNQPEQLLSHPSKPIFVADQQEYDEGMSFFDIPFEVDASLDIASVRRFLFHNVGLTYMKKRDCVTASDWFQKAVQSLEVSGLEVDIYHIQTLHNLAWCSYRQGQNNVAAKHYTMALEMAQKTINVASEVTQAASLNSLGVLHLYRNTDDDSRKAMMFFKQSLSMFRRCLGTDNAMVGTVLNNIGRVHYRWDEHEQGLQIYGEALRVRKLVLGADSIDVAATMYNYGQTYHRLGFFDKAMAHYLEFRNLVTKKFGNGTRDAAIVNKCIGEIYHAKGEHAKALEAFKEALKDGQTALGSSHPEIASCLNKLGNVCYEMNDHESALKYYQRGLQIEQLILQSSHPHIIITLTNMAHIYKSRGDYSLALSAYRSVHTKQVATYGESSIECAATLSSIGLMWYHLKYYEEAFEAYQQALRIRRDIYKTDDHKDIASTLNSIGLVLFKQDLLELSKRCFSESLRIRTKLFGKNHRDVAILWYNIATIHFETGQEEMAIRLYKETLRVERVALGPDHSDVVLTLQHIGQIMQQLGMLNEASEYLEQALNIERRRKTVNRSLIAKILNLIGNIQLQQGKIPEMMESFIEASRIYEENRRPGETLVIAGYNIYGLAKQHPPCAPVA